MSCFQENPSSSELRNDVTNVKSDVRDVMKKLQAFCLTSKDQYQGMKHIVDRTYDIVVDARFKVHFAFLNKNYKSFQFNPLSRTSLYCLCITGPIFPRMVLN